MSGRILVCDDEPAIAEAVAYSLRAEGLDVEVAGDGEAALEAAGSRPFDVLVLDLRLPGISGIEVCRRLREESDIPIIMLTARAEEVDRVLGLETGADDYVVKPFSMAELVSRVRATLRRRALDRRSPEVLELGGLRIDLSRREVTVDGTGVALTRSEFELLALLAEEPGRVYDRRAIMQRLWRSDFVGDARACDVHVSNLRAKIEPDPAEPRWLLTVRGIGYRLAPV